MTEKPNEKKKSKSKKKRASKGMRKHIRRKKADERSKVGTGQS
jgi:hypothetical protein